jgi:hypothetical protein
MATTTFRRDVTERLAALAEDFKNAPPTLLLRVYKRRPTGFTPDLPAVYVGSKNETITHTSGLRQRTMEPQLVLVGNPTGAPDEIADEVDTLVDYFLDYITVHPHAISSNTVTQVTTIRDVELEVDDVVYPAAVLTLGDTIALEGRSRSGA